MDLTALLPPVLKTCFKNVFKRNKQIIKEISKIDTILEYNSCNNAVGTIHSSVEKYFPNL